MKDLPINILIVWEATEVRLLMDGTCVATVPVTVHDTPTYDLAERVFQTAKELAKSLGRPILLSTASGKIIDRAAN